MQLRTLHFKAKPVLQPKDKTPEELAQFLEDCGNQYIVSVDMGGAFVALLKYKASSTEDSSAFDATFSVGAPSVSADASYSEKMKAFTKNLQLELNYELLGGAGVPADTSVESIIKFSLDFPKSITAKNMAYIGFGTEDYNRIRVRAGDYREAAQTLDALRDALIKRENFLVFLRGVRQTYLDYGVADTQSALRKQIEDEIVKSKAHVKSCSQSPATQCGIPTNLGAFDVDRESIRPMIRVVPFNGASVSMATESPGRHLKLFGRVCWDGENSCFIDGVSNYPPVYVEVNLNGARSRYTGPMTLPAPGAGAALKIDLRVVDPNYGGNSGDFKAILY